MTRAEFMELFVRKRAPIVCPTSEDRTALAEIMDEDPEFALDSGSNIRDPLFPKYPNIHRCLLSSTAPYRFCGTTLTESAGSGASISFEDAMSVFTEDSFDAPSEEEFSAALDVLFADRKEVVTCI